MESAASRPPLWTRHSSILLGGFLLTIFLILYIWWPLAEEYLAFVDWQGAWWRYIDWLLVGIFLFMSFTIIAGADLRRDSLIIFVGVCGGLAIESWGTQTNLWHYYTAERPPLWIIPVWPIASLCIDRIHRFMDFALRRLGSSGESSSAFKTLYWLVFSVFLLLLFSFVFPTFHKTYTILSCLLCVLLALTPTDHRKAALIFLAGSGLGYFLERWGTTRACWVYYTREAPPLFAVLAHGMAAVAFWRVGLLAQWLLLRLPRPAGGITSTAAAVERSHADRRRLSAE
jgi:hypothetical protein